jgi:hypothetical protein
MHTARTSAPLDWTRGLVADGALCCGARSQFDSMQEVAVKEPELSLPFPQRPEDRAPPAPPTPIAPVVCGQCVSRACTKQRVSQGPAADTQPPPAEAVAPEIAAVEESAGQEPLTVTSFVPIGAGLQRVRCVRVTFSHAVVRGPLEISDEQSVSASQEARDACRESSHSRTAQLPIRIKPPINGRWHWTTPYTLVGPARAPRQCASEPAAIGVRLLGVAGCDQVHRHHSGRDALHPPHPARRAAKFVPPLPCVCVFVCVYPALIHASAPHAETYHVLAADISYRFATEAPAVSAAFPENGARDVPVDAMFRLEFNQWVRGAGLRRLLTGPRQVPAQELLQGTYVHSVGVVMTGRNHELELVGTNEVSARVASRRWSNGVANAGRADRPHRDSVPREGRLAAQYAVRMVHQQ